MLPWFLKPAFLVDPQTLVITFPSVLPHHPPFIITATISLVPTALGACLCNWTEGERCEQPRSLTVFDRVNLSKLAVFSSFFSFLVLLDWNYHWWFFFFLKSSSSRNWASYFQWRADPCSHPSRVMRPIPLLSNHQKAYNYLVLWQTKAGAMGKRQWPPLTVLIWNKSNHFEKLDWLWFVKSMCWHFKPYYTVLNITLQLKMLLTLTIYCKYRGRRWNGWSFLIVLWWL